MRKVYFVGLLVGFGALAQTVTDQFNVVVSPQNFKADMAFDQRLRVNGVVRIDGGCIGCQTGIASGTWDFPPLGGSAELDTPCYESATLAVPGAVLDDDCRATSNLGKDGGARLLSTAWLECTTVTGGAVFKLCARFTDGGSYNLHDAGFTARTYR